MARIMTYEEQLKYEGYKKAHGEIKKRLTALGNEWMIALEGEDGEFEHVVAKDHPFFKKLKQFVLSENQEQEEKKCLVLRN